MNIEQTMEKEKRKKDRKEFGVLIKPALSVILRMRQHVSVSDSCVLYLSGNL